MKTQILVKVSSYYITNLIRLVISANQCQQSREQCFRQRSDFKENAVFPIVYGICSC